MEKAQKTNGDEREIKCQKDRKFGKKCLQKT